MAGGGEVNMGGWLPPPGAFGYVCMCVCIDGTVKPADVCTQTVQM